MFRCFVFLALLLSASAFAAPDKTFLSAREAFQKGKYDQLARQSQRIPTDYPLQSYLRYWQLKADDASPDELRAFAEQNPDSPLSQRAWQELTRFYGKNEDWANFRLTLDKLARLDAETRCYALRARLAANERDAEGEGARLYRDSQDLPSSCGVLFATLETRAIIGTNDKLARLRLALERDNGRLAREINANLPAEFQAGADTFELAQRAPEDLLASGLTGPVETELTLHALARIAKEDPDAAARNWLERHTQYPEPIQQSGWGVIAMHAARRQHGEAVNWFLLAGDSLSELQRLWKARTMVRAGRWLDVYRTIAAMPATTQEEAVWRYWQARALKALNVPLAANQVFARLSRELNYYGLLAGDELPTRLEMQTPDYVLTADDLRFARRHPGLNRALLLRKLGLESEAVAEWEWALRPFDDRKLLAAAEVARQETWYDRAIITAEKTREVHSFDLRYLTPYRDLAETHARRNGLDPAWVYGLMRQESRFVDYARSSAGARGLMQIMPETAKWIARQLGLSRKADARVQEPETNIRFGTYYLKRIFTDLQGSVVLATAGYNAGPGRARRWQADIPLEGAAYVESIPFVETREYVKKVLANATFYSQRLGLPRSALKARLGIVPARDGLPLAPVENNASAG